MDHIMIITENGSKYYGVPVNSTSLQVELKKCYVVTKNSKKPWNVGTCKLLRSEIIKEVAYII